MTKLTEAQISDKLANLEGWELNDNALETTFEFQNFKEAFTLMTRIAFECEAQNHHPDWSNVYNKLNIRLNTHDAGGVTEKDFKLAETIEALVSTNPE
ncbi:4a-hydroxytetrahydrobiopterin dehydratase [Robiginitalea aurantiaca]|uniref:Putative pterin-4-alpha-carbinolamine dehydratase n=1 Tax=Robiginitalea aurantiaca TaxID=3056915 RepID=A0ABT7WHT3_9FLAO|nr:4a-hydroxytetrahydrobiopterin dehydratase [Robiginitalea aurantiaca]MDM9632467.1 4a-hydroxytetrahydrobiopterin dehydratase [Robiginitalea aurantiaca]